MVGLEDHLSGKAGLTAVHAHDTSYREAKGSAPPRREAYPEYIHTRGSVATRKENELRPGLNKKTDGIDTKQTRPAKPGRNPQLGVDMNTPPPASIHIDHCNCQHSALSTQHSALSTQHPALSTQHSASSAQRPGASTQRPAPRAQRPALSTQRGPPGEGDGGPAPMAQRGAGR